MITITILWLVISITFGALTYEWAKGVGIPHKMNLFMSTVSFLCVITGGYTGYKDAKKEKEETDFQKIKVVADAVTTFKKEHNGKMPTPQELVPYFENARPVVVNSQLGTINLTKSLETLNK